VLEGRSADLLGSDELLASYLGGEAGSSHRAEAENGTKRTTARQP
jgi:hypothetical protein